MIQPLGDNIVIKLDNKKDETTGGILLPKAEAKKQGEVIAIGPGRFLKNGTRAPIDLNIGDTVIYGNRAGTILNQNGEDIMIMESSDVLAVVDD